MSQDRPNSRKCKTCKEDKPFSVDFFYISKNHRYGLSTECRECTKEKSRNWSRINKNLKAETDKKYAQKNKASISEYQKKYRANNKERSSAYMKKYADENKEKLKVSRREYNSKIEVKKRRSENHINRVKYDKKYKLMCNVRSAVSDALSKQSGALRFLDYSIEELARHLERQFSEGMTWDNYGRLWHVDHILPSSSFHFERADDPDFKFCWALSNLRPLWAKDNLKKNAKRIFLI